MQPKEKDCEMAGIESMMLVYSLREAVGIRF